MQITIQSPGLNWFNKDAIKINGRHYYDMELKAFEVPSAGRDFMPPLHLSRFEAERISIRKTTERRFISNTINLAEYYGLDIRDIENLTELQSGYMPGWFDYFCKVSTDHTKFIHEDALRITAATLDELAGFEAGSGLSLIASSKLYYGLGLIYSISEMNYIAPAKRKIIMSRRMENVKVAAVRLHAKAKYNNGIKSGYSDIKYKRWFIDAEQK